MNTFETSWSVGSRPNTQSNPVGEQGVSNRLAEEEHAFRNLTGRRLRPLDRMASRRLPNSRAETAEPFNTLPARGNEYG